jgi:hypothetical protein
MISLMDDLLRSEPENATFHITRGFYRYRLAVLLSSEGNQGSASTIGAEGLMELTRVADLAAANPQSLVLASEAYSRIKPIGLRDGRRAVRYAEHFASLRPARDATALYHLAVAQNADRSSKEAAAETAHRALALISPPRNGHVYYVKSELEAIR